MFSNEFIVLLIYAVSLDDVNVDFEVGHLKKSNFKGIW